MKIRVFVFVLMAIFVVSCHDENETHPTKGEVQFSLSKKEHSGGRTEETALPAAVLLSIADAQNNSVVQNKKLPLFSFGNGYVSESLQFSTGHYKLTQFMVLDANDKVIYATPIEGSALAQYVNDPLPIDFSITASGSTLVVPQVLAITETDTPEIFGYVSFGLEVVDPFQSKIKEIIVDEGFNSISKTLFYYTGELVTKTKFFSCYNGCDLLDSVSYNYDSDGIIQSIVRYGVLYPTPPISTSFQFQNGLLKKSWYTGDKASNDYEIEYYFDSDNLPHHAIQRLKYWDGYKDFKYIEYSVNEAKDITSVSIYTMTSTGAKNSLQFKFDYTYSDLINPYPGPGGGYFPYINHMILSNKTTQYSNIGGVITEHSTCTYNVSYQSNEFGYPAKEIVSNPDGCLGEFDGTIKTFIYQ